MIAIPSGFNPQEYLSLEHQSNVRHEYRYGLVYAMAGSSDDHNRLCINLLTAVNLHLRDGNCQFFCGDVKVNYKANFFYYPDAFVTCDPRDRSDPYVKRYPKLIVEVLSPSTESFDRHEKFEDYQGLESLEEYVLIAQDKLQVECFHPLGEGPGQRWESVIYGVGEGQTPIGDSQILLRSIGLAMTIETLYRGVGVGRSLIS